MRPRSNRWRGNLDYESPTSAEFIQFIEIDKRHTRASFWADIICFVIAGTFIGAVLAMLVLHLRQ